MLPHVFVFVALHCEAKPILKHWKLAKYPGQSPFTIYTNNQKVLVVTGIGKIAMAAAVAYTLAIFPDTKSPVLINFGIAGHPHAEIGSLLVADKIINDETGKVFYPQLIIKYSGQTATLCTVSKIEYHYTEVSLYDMEAAAFYEIAAKFSSSELILCIKLVSDNLNFSVANINENRVEQWVTEQLTLLSDLISSVEYIKSKLAYSDDSLFEQVLTEFHFTVANANKLKLLLQRWQLLNPEKVIDIAEFKAKTAKEFIASLEKNLAQTKFYL